MEDPVELAMEHLKKLDKKSLLAYWIKGEFEEAKAYRELAKRAKNLGLPESLVETLCSLSKESKEHGERLLEIYKKTHGEGPTYPDIPSLEVYPVIEEFERAEDAIEALKSALRSEELAVRVYERLAEEVENEELKEMYRALAKVERSHYERILGEIEILEKIIEEKEGKEKEKEKGC